jgi:CDP-diacylglycerol--glycerol-3-phosphate 3-phosphatidyltransferase
MNPPNIITIGRLFLTAGVVCLLSAATGRVGESFWLLLTAEILFFITVVTDWLDGYLARKYNWESDFGRIADPFVDKITIVGALICLTALAGEIVRPWMVVVVAGREFLVTGLRGYAESRGKKFGAMYLGKVKLVMQATFVMIVLHGRVFENTSHEWLVLYLTPNQLFLFTRVTVWIMVAFTVISAIPYLVAVARIKNDTGTKTGG